MPTSANSKSVFKNEMEALEQVRDELRVQAHLMKADMKKKLVELDKKFQKLKRELHSNSVTRATEKSAEEMSDATRLLMDTVRDGLHRIRKSLKSE